MKRVLKWVARGLGVVVALVLVAVAVLWTRGGHKLALTGSVEVAPLAIPDTVEARERGAHLAAVYCAECHGADLGGQPLIDDPSFMILDAPNLTSGEGGLGADYDAADWDRAIRHGLGKRGNALLVMPSAAFYHLPDEDVAAIAAHLRSVPPVDRASRPRQASFVARIITGLGGFDEEIAYARIDHAAARKPKPPAGATPEHGEYLVRTLACRNCHGSELAGKPMPGPDGVISANLTPGGPMGAWTEEVFLKMIEERTGGHMPWGVLRAMNDDERRAVWRYLATLAPKPTPPSS